MKTVEIIGGIGPESTVVYYRSIVTSYRQQKSAGSYPSIMINSIDLTRMLGLIGENRLIEVTGYLVGEVQKLAEAGADFGLFAANTPHIVFDEIRRQASIPMISIVEATCQEAQALELRRLGLFGTRFTVQRQFYSDVFSQAGITLSLPELDEQDYIHDIYMNELVSGVVLSKTPERLLKIADRMKEQQNIEGVILGGTELTLILSDAQYNGIPFLNTTQIHVNRVVDELLS
jgi:aspartate racemase